MHGPADRYQHLWQAQVKHQLLIRVNTVEFSSNARQKMPRGNRWIPRHGHVATSSLASAPQKGVHQPPLSQWPQPKSTTYDRNCSMAAEALVNPQIPHFSGSLWRCSDVDESSTTACTRVKLRVTQHHIKL